MNITSKNGLKLLSEMNKDEKESIVIFIYDNGDECCHSFKGEVKLNTISDIIDTACKNESIVKVEVIERVETSSLSIKPVHSVDIRHKTFKPKRNRTSYLRTRTI